MVVVMFYAALHAVETLFRADKTNPHLGHDARNRTLKNVNRYKKIWENYRILFDASRSARYDIDSHGWIPLADVREQLVTRLYAIEASVAKLTKSDEILAPIWPDDPKG